MKQLIAIAACFALFLTFSSCAGTGAAVAAPTVDFVQLVGPEQLNWPTGEIEIQYGVRILNNAPEQITLRHIELTPSSGDAEGAYTVYQQRYAFNQSIAAQGTRDVTFWAKAYSQGRRYGIDAQSPITVRGVLFFDSATGPFRKVFVKSLSQSASPRR